MRRGRRVHRNNMSSLVIDRSRHRRGVIDLSTISRQRPFRFESSSRRSSNSAPVRVSPHHPNESVAFVIGTDHAITHVVGILRVPFGSRMHCLNAPRLIDDPEWSRPPLSIRSLSCQPSRRRHCNVSRLTLLDKRWSGNNASSPETLKPLTTGSWQ